MKLLYFAVTRHQYHYFKKLRDNLPRFFAHTTRLRFFPRGFLSMSGFGVYRQISFDDVISIKWAEVDAKRKNPLARLLYKGFLRAQIPWVVAVVHEQIRQSPPDFLVLWNGKKFHQAIAHRVAQHMGVRAVFFENGFLPNTTQMDNQGVNGGNSVPRELAFYKELQHTQKLAHTELPQQLQTRRKQGKQIEREQTLPKRFIFVPFQVAYDTQIIQYSPWLKDMRVLFSCLEQLVAQTDSVFVIKEHPSDRVSDYQDLHARANEHIVFSSHNTQTLIEQAQAVLTINSSVGLEALLFDKKVVVLGEAFYAIEGVVKTADSTEALRTVLCHLDEWTVDKELNHTFLKYLYHDYLIPTDWRAPDEPHYQAIAQRLISYRNSYQNA